MFAVLKERAVSTKVVPVILLSGCSVSSSTTHGEGETEPCLKS